MRALFMPSTHAHHRTNFGAQQWEACDRNHTQNSISDKRIFINLHCTTTTQYHCCLPHLENHILAIGIGQWATVRVSKDNRMCYVCSSKAVKNEAHFVLECPLIKPH